MIEKSGLAERREWEPVVGAKPDVGKLVHLAARMDSVDQEQIRGELTQVRRRAYEDELTIQATLVGCPGRSAMLRNGPILSDLNAMSAADAEGIVNTYNYDLAAAIIKIRSETPTANRYTYSARLGKWYGARASWKDQQIALYTESSARTKAQQDFYDLNGGRMGSTVLEPASAVCPVCQGWINRGEVPLRVALNNPGSFHPNCPHFWSINPDQVPQEDCPLVWMGN